MLSIESFYKEYPCSYNSPLNCDKPLETIKEVKGAKFCFECGFPTNLPEEAEIKGYRGSYRVTKYLGVRGFGRLYSGVQIRDQQPVLIKEYLLPSRSFNQDETFKRKETFKRIGGVELADGRVQNFRLIQTWEAIAPEQGERCYLITKDIQPSQTLRQYLKQYGAMEPEQVREFLDEVLQTLVFMHSQKLRFPSNQIQRGLEHGNISLDSVLIKVENKQRFVAYLCDIATWENLFVPPSIAQPAVTTMAQDLEALGLVAFQLWVGKTQSVDPKDHQAWPDTDIHLKKYLYRLLSLDTSYKSAEIARTELLKLPKPDQSGILPSSDLEEQKRFPKFFLNPWLWLILAFLLIGGAWYYFWHLKKMDDEKFADWQALVPNFSKVDNVPPGKFTYTGEQNGTWTFILTRAPENESRLNDILTKPIQNAFTTFEYQGVVSENVATASQPVKIVLGEVQKQSKDFAMTSLEEKMINLNNKKVAYDGLLVFVAFSKNNSNLPAALGGKISLEQLRKIYIGEYTDWRQVNPNLSSLKIEPFVPTEPEAVQQFKKLVLGNNEQYISLFEQKFAQFRENTGTTQTRIRTAIENKKTTGIISFGILSKTWDQCSGYPLGIVDKNDQMIQPLFRRVTRRAINPTDDLCDKANYFDVETFESDGIVKYPLGYAVYVVYPKNSNPQPAGLIFANMLKTRQGQCLLNKVGLVPLQPMPNDINYACESVSKP